MFATLSGAVVNLILDPVFIFILRRGMTGAAVATVNKGAFIYLQALGKAAASTAVSLAREIVFGVLLPILRPAVRGPDGLSWSFPAADLLTFFITVFFIRRAYRELST